MTLLQNASAPHRILLAPIAVGSLLVLAACGSDDDAPAGDQDQQQEQESNGAEDNQGEAGEPLTLEEVEENDSPDSCWAAIDGTVYDLTDWVEEHPGGSARIEQICGTDATDAFQGQHSGDEGPQNQLAEFEIGELQN